MSVKPPIFEQMAQLVTIAQILDAYPTLLKLVSGRPDVKIERPCSQEHFLESAIVFISDGDFMTAALNSSVSAIVLPPKLTKTLSATDKVILESPSPYLAMAKVNKQFFSRYEDIDPIDGQLIHSSAVVAKSAKLGQNVKIGANAVVGENVKIADGVSIGPQAFIGAGCEIGRDTRIHAQVFLGPNCKLGERCELKPQCVVGSDGFGFARDETNRNFHIPHYGGVIFGDEVHIGACTTIDAGTYAPSEVGSGTKIDNHCHFGHNIRIGKNTIIVGGMLAAGSVTIGDNCVFGGRITINGHISIASNVQMAPLSNIPASVDKAGVYGGFGALPVREAQRIQMTQPHLPRMRRTLARIAKQLGLQDE